MMKRKLLTIVSPLLVLALVFSLVSVFLMPKPAAAAPAPEVWVDDDYCEFCYNDGHLWGYDAFDNVQDGIDAVASPGIVHVAAGHYWQHIDLKDGVQLLGAGAGVTTLDRYAGSVVTAIGVGPETVLDGFTITNGYSQGGGMRNIGSSPTVTNCIFDHNTGTPFGGGMYNWASSPTVTNCIFSHNSAHFMGGGMYNFGNSSPTVANCIFHHNSLGPFAGPGGGICNMDNSSPTVTNCIFDHNSGLMGGGMYNDGSSPTVTSCTFSGNSASTGSAIRNDGSSPTVTNCILWDVGSEIWNHDSSPSVSYCDVRGSYPGEGNINADPMFVDPAGGDYHLKAGSPCIDVGNNATVPGWLTTDFEGNPRILDGNGDGEATVDMGAYEYFAWTCIFQDPARETELRVDTGNKIFQFIAPDGYDSGIVLVEPMIVRDTPGGQLIRISHSDSEVILFAFAMDGGRDFCQARVIDPDTEQMYLLLDPPGIE